MNVSYLENHLKAGGHIPNDIVDERDIYKYKRDKRAQNTINKALDTNYKAVFRRDYEVRNGQWSSKHVQIDTGSVFIVTSDNRVLHFSNSEWFSISPIEAHTYGG